MNVVVSPVESNEGKAVIIKSPIKSFPGATGNC